MFILSSDNGAVIDDGYKDQAVELLGDHKPFKALRGGKYSAYEGGTKVPLLVSWPRQVSKGVVSQALFSHIDFLATLSSIMGCEVPKSANVDSKNATKVLFGIDAQKGRDYIVQQSLNSTISISDGTWKYIQASSGPARSKDTNTELGNSSKELLFDLRLDKGEQNNIATTNPKVVESMQRIMNSEFSKGIYAKSPIDIYLYDDMPKTSQNDVVDRGTGFVRYVENPKIQLYLPLAGGDKKRIVLVVPGGGYSFVSNNNEGVQVAKWLNENGIAAAVLHYRLPAGSTNIPLEDAQKAMEVIQLSAKIYGLDVNNIGVIGFSAGGHLAGSLITMTKKAKLVPAYAILVYPVISMDSTITHMGSRNNLLGKNPSQKLIDKYSLEKQVSTKTPPTILVHCRDDKSVVIRNSQLFESAMQANGVEVKSVYFEKGSHGWGFTLSKLSNEDKAAFLSAVKNWIDCHN